MKRKRVRSKEEKRKKWRRKRVNKGDVVQQDEGDTSMQEQKKNVK